MWSLHFSHVKTKSLLYRSHRSFSQICIICTSLSFHGADLQVMCMFPQYYNNTYRTGNNSDQQDVVVVSCVRAYCTLIWYDTKYVWSVHVSAWWSVGDSWSIHDRYVSTQWSVLVRSRSGRSWSVRLCIYLQSCAMTSGHDSSRTTPSPNAMMSGQTARKTIFEQLQYPTERGSSSLRWSNHRCCSPWCNPCSVTLH